MVRSSAKPGLLPVLLLCLGMFLVFAPAAARAGVSAMAIADRASAAGFVPHKALYEIKLAGTKSGSQIINVYGQMFYDWQPACEAWVSNHRFNLFYEYADSPSMQITSDFSTYETFDGKSIDFTSQRKRDGQLFEEMRGHAAVGDDGAGEAVFTVPPDLKFELPKGSVFPMMHSLNVFDALKKNQKFYKAVIFDGSDQEGPIEINAFIGKAVDGAAGFEQSADIDTSLLASPAHQVRLAFFPLKDSTGAPDYEMTVVFHENGVISDMSIEYDDFSVNQKLIALEKLPGTCENQGNPAPATP